MGKIIDYKNLASELKKIKPQGTLVLVGGCFDVLHTGHFEFLKKAKAQGDILIVVLESDDSIKKWKGENRPVNTQVVRCENLNKVEEVDYVLPIPPFNSDKDYYELTKQIEPDIIAVTKNDQRFRQKKEQADLVGGEVIEVIERLENFSTTKLLKET